MKDQWRIKIELVGITESPGVPDDGFNFHHTLTNLSFRFSTAYAQFSLYHQFRESDEQSALERNERSITFLKYS